MSSLRSRVEKLEGRATPSTVLITLVEPEESAEQAIERAARAWRRPVETFAVKIVLDFHGSGEAVTHYNRVTNPLRGCPTGVP